MHLLGSPRRPEFDQYTIKFVIGTIALALPFIEIILTKNSITSISQSFWAVEYWPGWTKGLWSRNIFVGFLFAISTLLLAFNGRSELEMWLGKVASACAIGVAMFPCNCGSACHEIVVHVHMGCAGLLFGVLGVFCVMFLLHAQGLKHRQGRRRVYIYALCCLGMISTVVLFIVSTVTDSERLIFWGETIGLVSFGFSWLTASHTIPYLAHENEYVKLIVPV